MARPTLFSNRKFIKLAQRLQSRALALGHLEFIWAAAHETGNSIIGDADDVEAVADWRGDRGELVAALVEAGSNGGAGFIVPVEGGLGSRYEIHDYWHHAPDYVRKRARRESERRTAGNLLLDSDRSKRGADTKVTGQAASATVSAEHDFGADRSEASTDALVTGQNGVGSPKNSVFFRTPAPAPAPRREDNPPTPLEGGPGSPTRSKRKPRDARTASSAAWGLVIEGSSRTHQRAEIERADPLIVTTVQRLGGWNKFGHSKAIGMLKAPFRELYEQLLEQERATA